jgi:hypothetical protein
VIQDEIKNYLKIVKGATWLCLFCNRYVSPQEVFENIKKSFGIECPFSLEQVTECLDYYFSIGGCSRITKGGDKTYHFMPDMDDDKRILFPDGGTFFYAKDSDTLNEWKDLLHQQIKLRFPSTYRHVGIV